VDHGRPFARLSRLLYPVDFMGFAPGTKLGPYEIVAPLGAGGMGEVFRARDMRLNRDVAIKTLPAALAGNEHLLLRFEREAKAISSLNHPNICTLYDVGHTTAEAGARPSSQLHYLVMELIDGESIADRIEKGPLPIHEVIRYGRQIASALDAAHRQGIVHRDLKPANVMLTRAGAKLLDFGLARTAAGEPPPLSTVGSSTSHLATEMGPEPRPLTTAGMILGTFQYMAPEQLEGTEADARTDIFALGALLYEMATGKRAFQGSSKTSLIAAIVSAQPAPISSVTPMTPPALEHLVRRCLEKNPEDRWQSAHDVAAELQWIGEAGSQPGGPAPLTPRRQSRETLAWGLAAVLAVTAVAAGLAWVSGRAPSAPRAYRATLMPPPDHALIPFDQLGLALSPDGKMLAFVAAGADNRKQIWIRNLAEMTALPLAETMGASYPFWSPDGRSLGFFSEAKLKTIDLRGGSPRVLADAPTGRGGSWGRDGTILFAPNITSSILSVPADGGNAAPATAYDPNTETTHRWPVFLPDGRHFLYLSRAHATGRREVGRLMLASLDGMTPSELINDASNALYVEPGFLVYARSANLYAWRFDSRALRLEGQPVPIVPDKTSYWEAKNFVPFAASDDGTIVYLPDAIRSTQMKWYDREGRPLGDLGPAGFYGSARISPDGRRLAYIQGDSPQAPVNIWIRDLQSGSVSRLTQQSGLYANPIWAPDSDRIAFLCQPKGMQDLCITSLSGGGESRLLYESSTWKSLGSWLPDGQRLLFSIQDPKADQDIVMLPAGAGPPIDVLRTPFVEQSPEVSPDGARMAYISNQSGRYEVYVRSLEGGSGQWQISNAGGNAPRWRADGREIFYIADDGQVMSVSVPVPSAGTFKAGTPIPLFQTSEAASTNLFQDVTPDGQRILLSVPTSSVTSIGFHAIFGWKAIASK